MTENDINRVFGIIFAMTAAVFALVWLSMRRARHGGEGTAGGGEPGARDKSGEGGGGFLGYLWRGDSPASGIAVLAIAAFIVRIAFATSLDGLPNDMACFRAWSSAAATDLTGMYNNVGFLDYPPGYMYVLMVIGLVGNALGAAVSSSAYCLLIKAPPILADVATGVIIYAAPAIFASRAAATASTGAKKLFGRTPADNFASSVAGIGGRRLRLFIAGAYLFNPVVFFDSTVWGQIDSVLALIAVCAIICHARGLHFRAGALFALAILVKPQGAMLLPLLFVSLAAGIVLKRTLIPTLKTAGGAALALAVVAGPFWIKMGPGWLFDLYMGTLGGYEYASVNAFNMFALIGANWAQDSNELLGVRFSTWGVLAIVLCAVIACAALFLDGVRAAAREDAGGERAGSLERKKRGGRNERGELEERKERWELEERRGRKELENRLAARTARSMFIAAAALQLGVVTFGHRMHERYFFPAIVFLIAAASLAGSSERAERAKREKSKEDAESAKETLRSAAGVGRAVLDSLSSGKLLTEVIFVTAAGYANMLLVFSAILSGRSPNFYETPLIYAISFVNVAAALWIVAAVARRADLRGLKQDFARLFPGSGGGSAGGSGGAASGSGSGSAGASGRGGGNGGVSASAAATGPRRASAAACAVSFAVRSAVRSVERRAVRSEVGSTARRGAACAVILAFCAVLAALASPFGLCAARADVDAAAGVASGQPVDVVNAGFEQGLDGWLIYDYREQYEGRTDAGDVSVVNDVAFGGDSALRVENASVNDVRVHQQIDVEPNSIYRVSCYARVDGVSEGAGANASALNFLVNSNGLSGSVGEFTELVYYGQTGPDQKNFSIAFGVGGYSSESVGVAWFDDVRVEKVDYIPAGASAQLLYSEDAGNDGGGDDDNAAVDAGSRRNNISGGALFFLTAALAALLAYLFKAIVTSRGEPAADLKTDGALADVGAPAAPTLARRIAVNWRSKLVDVGVVLALTAVCAAISLTRLGGHIAPQTFWKPVEATDEAVVSFPEASQISKIMYNCNVTQHSETESRFEVFALSPEGSYEKICDLSDKAFYEWKSVDVSFTAERVKLVAAVPGMAINEIAFVTPEGYVAEATVSETNFTQSNFGDPNMLVDEPSTVPDRPDYMNGTYFDEIYFPRTAYEHIHDMPIFETTHPPLGKLIIALGITLFGMNPFGWRIMGALAGIAMVPAIYFFGKKLFGGSRFWAAAAAFLLMADFMRFAQSRLATIDAFTTLAIMMIYHFMSQTFSRGIAPGVTAESPARAGASRARGATGATGATRWRTALRAAAPALPPLALSGLAFGLGSATKWIALYAGAGVALVFFAARAREIYLIYRPSAHASAPGALSKPSAAKIKENWRAFAPKLAIVLAACVVFFIVIPGAIYVFSYVPYTRTPGSTGSLWSAMANNQRDMLSYHSSLTDTHSFESPWWSWPLMVKPIWFYAASGLPEGVAGSISSFGNPLIWWIGIPCMFFAAFWAIKRRDARMAVVVIAFLFQYAPWIFITRATFIYHFFSATPFVILAIVYTLRHFVESRVLPRFVVFVYLAAAAAMFAIYYPALSGIPTPSDYLDSLKLFSSWYW